MTSVEIRKKFLACRHYNLRGVDPVEQEMQTHGIYRAESFKCQRNERVSVSQRLVFELLPVCSAVSGVASG